jgi:hypothetical protein
MMYKISIWDSSDDTYGTFEDYNASIYKNIVTILYITEILTEIGALGTHSFHHFTCPHV